MNPIEHQASLSDLFLTRRQWLGRFGMGMGAVGLAALLGEEARAAADLNPLAPKNPHFPAKAKRVIHIFAQGAPSHVDTWDPKPALARHDGKTIPGAGGVAFGSPFKFTKQGRSGIEFSEVFPKLAQHADSMAVVRSLHTDIPAHDVATVFMNTGSLRLAKPSLGSWVLYGLGTENQDLPGFITLCPTLGHGGVNNWSSAFLPGIYQGTPIGNASTPAKNATIRHLANTRWRSDLQRSQLDLLQKQNAEHLAERPGDAALEARIESYELAWRMQGKAAEVLDIANESEATKKLYGIDNAVTENFGRQCLMARRLCEAGVRFVQCTHSYKWDQHDRLHELHTKNAAEVDLPIAGLLQDLAARGLLEDTLVLWGGEFGRTPTVQGSDGRDHNPHGFTMWMAGGGVKPGFSYGETDDYGFYAAKDKVHVHDLHATMLALLGIDHEQLTYRWAGRDFRLTDVHGRVVRELFA